MTSNTIDKAHKAGEAYTAAFKRVKQARHSLVHELSSTPGLRMLSDSRLKELFLEYDSAYLDFYRCLGVCCNSLDDLMSAAVLGPVAEPAPKADLSEQLAQDHLIAALGFTPSLEYIRETYGPHWDSCSANKAVAAPLAALAKSVVTDEPALARAVLRVTDGERIGIECTMLDGQKGAFIQVDADFPELAAKVVELLSADLAKSLVPDGRGGFYAHRGYAAKARA